MTINGYCYGRTSCYPRNQPCCPGQDDATTILRGDEVYKRWILPDGCLRSSVKSRMEFQAREFVSLCVCVNECVLIYYHTDWMLWGRDGSKTTSTTTVMFERKMSEMHACVDGYPLCRILFNYLWRWKHYQFSLLKRNCDFITLSGLNSPVVLIYAYQILLTALRNHGF